jgi:hypothetical protein
MERNSSAGYIYIRWTAGLDLISFGCNNVARLQRPGVKLE